MSGTQSAPQYERAKRDSSRTAGRTGAVLSTELVFALPIVFGLLLAVLEVSLIWVGNHRVAAAARAGCWVARLAGSTEAEVEKEVVQTLGKGPLVMMHKTRVIRGPHSGDPVLVEVSAPMRAASPDMLGILGFGLGDRKLTAQCLMRRE